MIITKKLNKCEILINLGDVHTSVLEFYQVFYNFSECLKFSKLKSKTNKNFCKLYHNDKCISILGKKKREKVLKTEHSTTEWTYYLTNTTAYWSMCLFSVGVEEFSVYHLSVYICLSV